MRAVFFAALLCCASAAAAAPAAQSAFAERTGLLEVDSRCRLFTANIRYALEAGAAQARGALLRAGWSEARVRELAEAARQAAGERACDDAGILAAAATARAGFASWARMPAMTFAGGERSWMARRLPDPGGWRLRQNVPVGAAFGVREVGGAAELDFVAPLGGGATPAAAQIILRDPHRARANFDVPGRLAQGLEAAAPSPAAAQRFWASARRVETTTRGQRYVAFAFPDGAFQALLLLDPREAVEVRFGAAGDGERFLIEVGDIAAARAFLAIRPD
ncbi:MAG TPA: hypothetical protein VG841_07480 [Caulobacterales bacterium]|nr:hypothetical protein [Caulobacterales bacterium]